MTKIAYCLLVHKNPQQVNRLIRNIYSPSDIFYVNVFGDNSTKESWLEALKEFESDSFFVVFKYANSWGTFELVDTLLDSMKEFSRFDYDYCIDLSGQCYPLKSVKEIKQFLHNNTSAYMENFTIPAPHLAGRGGLSRIYYYYYRHPLYLSRDYVINKLSKTAKCDSRRFIRIPRRNRQLPYNLTFYGGSTWFYLPKKHIEYIIDYAKNNPKVTDFFKRILYPDEHFFHTILMNSPLSDTVVNDNLRYIDWSKKGVPLPAVLSINDADSLLNSSKFFARKFDAETDEEILDLIDKHKN